MRQITLASAIWPLKRATFHHQSTSGRLVRSLEPRDLEDPIIELLRDSAACTGSIAAPLLDWAAVANFAQGYGQFPR